MIFESTEPMLSHLRTAISTLFVVWIAMAHVAGQEDREKTTALKGEYGTMPREFKSEVVLLDKREIRALEC